MTTVTVTETPAPVEPVEPDAAIEPEVVQAAVDASVTIAAIQADRDVEIATIQADTRLAEAERTYNERMAALEVEIEQCRTTIADLRRENSEMTERLSLIQPLSGPAIVSPTNPSGEENPAQTPDNPVDPAAHGEPAPKEPARRKARFRWI